MPAYGKRRALGQHFLRDAKVIQAILDRFFGEWANRIASTHTLLEIGPGEGALTRPLLEHLRFRAIEPNGLGSLKEVVIAERDRELIELWKKSAQELSPVPVRILEGDFLDRPTSAWTQGKGVCVVSNLPYSAGTAIVVKLASESPEVQCMVLMFQAEVAKRLRAGPSGDGRGSLSVFIQNVWDVQKLVSVPRGAFSPPPDVESEVVVLSRRKTPWVPDSVKSVENFQIWNQLLRVCFAQRRKMLRSGLSSHSRFKKALENSGVDGTLRAEALDWPQWVKLYAAVLATGQ